MAFPANTALNQLERRITFKADGNQTVFALPDSFIFAHSDSVWKDSVYQYPGKDYDISFFDGYIRFYSTPSKNATILIKYYRLGLTLKRCYFHQQIQNIRMRSDTTRLSQSTASSPENPPSTREQRSEGANLQKSGSIIRGISIGTNQGLKLDSGLRMQVSGRVADKLEIIAALTDQNTPIQPEGNTQTLQEIDKVFVQIKSERFNATLGDYQLRFDGTEFGRYDRKLQGAMATAALGDFETTVSGAVSRGQYFTNQFMGQEGNQGPYQLRGERGQTDIIVIAGTERIWIDGELMTRGENNDYTIEYSNGQITFTRQRLITSDSRITVDFQYSDQKFRRNLYSARSKALLWSDKLSMQVIMLHEADDKDNPLDFILSDATQEQLREAGDSMDSAYVSSARFVGENQGNYIQKDSLGIQFYQYAGQNKGDYAVSFSYVGYGKGDYKLVEIGKYTFVGSGNGSYIAKILLTPARSNDLIDFGIGFSPTPAFAVESEIALSRLDLNTYSSMDDADNQGFAYNLNLGIKPQRIRYLGKFELDGKFRYVNPRFQQIDRTTEVEYNRRWDLETSTTNQEQVQELRLGYAPWESLTLKSGFGRIDKQNAFHSRRWDFQTALNSPKLPGATYRLEKINSENPASSRSGNWERQKAGGNYEFWKLRPELLFESEIKQDVFADTFKTGFRFQEIGGGLAFSPWEKLNLSAFGKKRADDEVQASGFAAKSTATTQQYKLSVNHLGSFSGDMTYTHRNKHFVASQEPDQRTDLAELNAGYAVFAKAVSSQWHYQISNTQTSKRERVPRKVEEGEGNYRYDPELNEFVPDPLGDYVLFVMNTDIFIPIIELKASTTWRIKPANLFGKKKSRSVESAGFWQNLLDNISGETMIRLEEKTQEDDVSAIYGLQISKFQNYEKTIYGANYLRQDIHFISEDQRFSLRLRLQRQDEMNNQYLEGGQSLYRLDRTARINWKLSDRLSTQINLINLQNRREFHFPGRKNRDVLSNEVTLDQSYRPKSALELALKSRVGRDVDRFPETPLIAYLFALLPRVNCSFRGKGRLLAELDWSLVKTSEDDANAVLPYEMAGGNQVGQSWRWSITFNYRLSRNIQTSFSYTGRNEPYRPDIIHLGRAEMQAFF
ncbi:hypothetical protein JXJ21_23025 [candidate division KSB1 bacterium]|nr:hypothetical protein [candidate division KSB1 bacterium]